MSEPQKSEPQNGRGALFAGGLAAILASACCLGPLVLIALGFSGGHCCKVSDEAAFCLIQRPYISKTLLTRRISPRGSP